MTAKSTCVFLKPLMLLAVVLLAAPLDAQVAPFPLVFTAPPSAKTKASTFKNCPLALRYIAFTSQTGQVVPEEEKEEIINALEAIPWETIDWVAMARSVDPARQAGKPTPTRNDILKLFGVSISQDGTAAESDVTRIRDILTHIGRLAMNPPPFDRMARQLRQSVPGALEQVPEAGNWFGRNKPPTRIEILADFVNKRVFVFDFDNPEMAAYWALADLPLDQKPHVLIRPDDRRGFIKTTRALFKSWGKVAAKTFSHGYTFADTWNRLVGEYYRIVLNANMLVPGIATEARAALIVASKFPNLEEKPVHRRLGSLPEKFREVAVQDMLKELKAAQYASRGSDAVFHNGVKLDDITEDLVLRIVTSVWKKKAELAKDEALVKKFTDEVDKQHSQVDERERTRLIEEALFYEAMRQERGDDFVNAYRHGMQAGVDAWWKEVSDARTYLRSLFDQLAIGYRGFLKAQQDLDSIDQIVAKEISEIGIFPLSKEERERRETEIRARRENELRTKRDQVLRDFVEAFLKARSVAILLDMTLNHRDIELYHDVPIVHAMGSKVWKEAEKTDYRASKKKGAVAESQQDLIKTIATRADGVLSQLASGNPTSLTARLISEAGKMGALTRFTSSTGGRISTAVIPALLFATYLWGGTISNWIFFTPLPGNQNFGNLANPVVVPDDQFEKEVETILKKLVYGGIGGANYKIIQSFFEIYPQYDWSKYPGVKERLDYISKNGFFSKHSVLFYRQVRYGSVNWVADFWDGGRQKYQKEIIDELAFILKALRIANQQDHDRFHKQIQEAFGKTTDNTATSKPTK